MKVGAGLCVDSGGLTVKTAQGMKVEAGGLTVDDNVKVGNGLCVTSGGLTVASSQGLKVNGGGLTVSHNMKIGEGLCIISGGFTVAGAIYFRQQTVHTYRHLEPYTTSSSFTRYTSGRRLGLGGGDASDVASDVVEGPLSSDVYLSRMLGSVEEEVDSESDEDAKEVGNIFSMQGVTEYLLIADIRLNRFELDFDELRDEYLDTQDDVLRLTTELASLKKEVTELWKLVNERTG